MKRANLIVAIIIAIFAFTNVSDAQKIKKTTKLAQTYFTISPSAGLIFPVGNFSETFNSGTSLGLDMGYRINKEVGFYGKFGYNSMNSKTDGVSSGRYMEFSAGPRYYMTDPKLSSMLYLEGGVGAYMFDQDAYTLNGVTFNKSSQTKTGVNAGIGANLAISNEIDLLVKTKYHTVFADGGSNSFITAIGGIEFKIR